MGYGDMAEPSAAKSHGNKPRQYVAERPAVGRPSKDFPTPGTRCRNGIWKVFWWAAGKTYELSCGRVSSDDAEQTRLEVAIAIRTGDWPGWAASAAAVQRYLSSGSPSLSTSTLLAEYATHLAAEVEAGWAATSIAHLRELEAVSGKPLAEVTPADAQAFLDHVRQTPGPYRTKKGVRSVATRNRARTACSRFYRWARQRGVRHNPFAETRKLTEAEVGEIVHLTHDEREAVLDATVGDPDGLAVWIALFCGLRRGEIIRCEWTDFNLDRRKLVVLRAKTGRQRYVDLPRRLVDRLRKVPKKMRAGLVTGWPSEEQPARYAAECCLERLRVKLRAEDRDEIADKLEWNVLRHTFASLLVQAGVSIFKVSRWMGNSVDVCTRHYAAMMPEHDGDIEKLS